MGTDAQNEKKISKLYGYRISTGKGELCMAARCCAEAGEPAALKYMTLVRDITVRIDSGEWKPGNRLPSIREMAERYGCSKNTVIRAYDELERSHLVFAVAKSGYYVVEKQTPPGGGANRTGPSPAASAPAAAIDFASAAPDETALPYEDFRHCLNRAIDLYRDTLFAYGDPQGLGTLRETLRKQLCGDQLFAGPERLFVVSGAQQALHLLVGMPFPNGKRRILVEQPTYFGILRSIALQRQTAIGVSRTPKGIDFEELEKHFRHNDIKFFYTVPRFNNPYGLSYTMEEKRRLVRLAERYDVYIVEDDYLADLDPDAKADPLAALSASGHVVYVKSFSKTVLPGIRLGAVVVPENLVPPFLQHKAAADSSTSILSQGALEIYLKSGMFERHVSRVRKLYASRMQAMREAAAALLPPAARFVVPQSGVFAALELPDGIRAEAFASRLAEKGVKAVAGTRLFLPDAPKHSLLRLSVMRAGEREIRSGLERIARELEHAAKFAGRTGSSAADGVQFV